MTKSKITQVFPTGSSEWNGKQLNKFLVTLENGENGTLTTGFSADDKTPEAGQELEYTLEDKGFGPEIKPVRAGGGSRGGGFAKKTPEQEANLNAIAITKSALEGTKMPLSEWKQTYIEAYTFFLGFAKQAPGVTVEAPANENGATEPANKLPF